METTRSVRDASRLRRLLMAALILALLAAAAVGRGRTSNEPAPATAPGSSVPAGSPR